MNGDVTTSLHGTQPKRGRTVIKRRFIIVTGPCFLPPFLFLSTAVGDLRKDSSGSQRRKRAGWKGSTRRRKPTMSSLVREGRPVITRATWAGAKPRLGSILRDKSREIRQYILSAITFCVCLVVGQMEKESNGVVDVSPCHFRLSHCSGWSTSLSVAT